MPASWRKFALAVLVWLVCAPFVDAQTTPLRVVLLLDRSKSMERVYLPAARPGGNMEVIAFDELLGRLSDFVLTELPDDTEITLITFGAGAYLEGSWTLVDAGQRRKARDAFRQVRPDQDHTNLSRALEAALQHVTQASDRKTRDRGQVPWLILLISDGKNNPPPNETLRLDDVRQLPDRLGLTPRKDFVFWYAHIGEPEQELQDVARLWGQVLELKADWELEVGDIAPREVDVQALPGSGTAELKLILKRRKRGAVTFRAEAENLPESAAVTVESFEVEPDQDREVVRLKLAYKGLGPGEYLVRVRAVDENPLNLLQAVHVLVKLRVVAPKVVVTPELVRLSPVSIDKPRAIARVLLRPDHFAQELGVPVDVTVADTSNRGVTLTVSPARVVLRQPQELELRAQLEKTKVQEPGTYSAEIRFTAPHAHLVFQPERVRVVGTIEPISLHVEAHASDPTLKAGKNELVLTLSAPAQTLRDLGRLNLALETPQVEGKPPLRVQAPRQVALSPDMAEAELRLLVEVPVEDPGTGGRWQVRIPVRSDSPLVRVVPGEFVLSLVRRPEPRKVRLTPAHARVVVLPHDVQRGVVRVPAQFETPAGISQLPLRVQVVPLSEDAPELSVRDEILRVRPNQPVEFVLGTEGEWPPGRWQYRLELSAVEDLIVLEPASMELVVESPLRWVSKPPPLRPGVVRWPFEVEILFSRSELPQDLNLVSFQYAIGDGPFRDGTVEVVAQDGTVKLLCRGGESVNALTRLETDRVGARFRLTSGGQVLLEWNVPIEVRPPIVRSLEVRVKGDAEVRSSTDSPRVEATATGPYSIEVKAEVPGVIPPEVTPEVLLLETLATTPERLRQEVLAVLNNSSVSERVRLQQVSLTDLALGTEVYREQPPEPGWFRGRPEVNKQFGIAVVVREPSGVTTCTDVAAVSIVVPSSSAPLTKALILLGVVILLVLGGSIAVHILTPRIVGLRSVEGPAKPRPRELQACLVWDNDWIEPLAPSASRYMVLFHETSTPWIVPWRCGVARVRCSDTNQEVTIWLSALSSWWLTLRADADLEIAGIRYPAGKRVSVRALSTSDPAGYRTLEIGWPGAEGEATLTLYLKWVPPGTEAASPGTEVLATP